MPTLWADTLVTDVLESAIYRGEVLHQRFTPTQHKFVYDIYLFWLKLSEMEQLANIDGFNVGRKGMLEFRRSDYISPEIHDMSTAVLDKANALKSELDIADPTTISGDVYFMGQPRMLGLYFSPVNFYFIKSDDTFTYMLAEVSNTPWHERHYYLVDLAEQADTDKMFHVSPFNPIDMVYKWRISEPAEQFTLQLSCHKDTKHMTAGLRLTRHALTPQNLLTAKKSIPSMTVKTVIGIYWEAVKLFIKRTPFYGHPGSLRNEITQPKD
ncbi:DUF1365 domain-containing protein [Opacimonas viscosa]|uniref:DUF1365 domain-containing protein n=1 Tax=Opacimonas viscosa TaxID=2961944 RepID=A0AA42BLN5_9ALTE|nr:DUF1365 domain-containing protein [Opacimonas viscosa]MCP3428980.1 DUF1365 domain-containing protein [Opacimonas viscosa]